MDVVAERLQRRHVDGVNAFLELAADPRSTVRVQRNTASVLPEPVGAAIRVSAPAAMLAQPSI